MNGGPGQARRNLAPRLAPWLALLKAGRRVLSLFSLDALFQYSRV